jgi:hypothetical protein
LKFWKWIPTCACLLGLEESVYYFLLIGESGGKFELV